MKKKEEKIRLGFIGRVKTEAREIPRHWSRSEAVGRLVIKKKYQKGLKDIKAGQRIVVIFHFHRSAVFSPTDHLIQKPHHDTQTRGVFSICSPLRPNPLGLSVLEVLDIEENIITVKGIDMIDGTPILDIKPYIQ